MITTSDFKKQISKPFGMVMRQHGLKGSGFNFFQETEEFLIAVYIEPGRWGNHCQLGLAIHPKQIQKDQNGVIDIKNLKIHQYEFKMQLMQTDEWWDYSKDETANATTLAEIVKLVKEKAFPVIKQFTSIPSVLDLFKVDEMSDFHANWTERTGTFIAITDSRFAWAMAIIFERINPQKALQFAKWANGIDKSWFGYGDLERICANTSTNANR